jgi:hypothetical protein
MSSMEGKRGFPLSIRPTTLRRISGAVKAMQFPELIEARADVMMGKPCLKGTRIPVYLILEKLAAGDTRAYPFCISATQARTHHGCPRLRGPSGCR